MLSGVFGSKTGQAGGGAAGGISQLRQSSRMAKAQLAGGYPTQSVSAGAVSRLAAAESSQGSTASPTVTVER